MQKVKVEDLADFRTHQVDEKLCEKRHIRSTLLDEVVSCVFEYLKLFDMHNFIFHFVIFFRTHQVDENLCEKRHIRATLLGEVVSCVFEYLI